MKLITVTLAIFLLAAAAQAQINCTLEECEQNFGHGDLRIQRDGRLYDCFTTIESRPEHEIHYQVLAFFVGIKVCEMAYSLTKHPDNPPALSVEDAEFLLAYRTPEIVWSKPSRNADNTEMIWTGSVNGQLHYVALFDGTQLLEITRLRF